MYSSGFYSKSINLKNYSEERVFIYEVFLPFVKGGRVWFKVPFDRMGQQTRQIYIRGGKIISILPLTTSTSNDPPSNLAWWVEIITSQPRCFYFFGPFSSAEEAKSHQNGYIEDLLSEGAIAVDISVKYCQPRSLTIELE
jgi:hypothetical protein